MSGWQASEAPAAAAAAAAEGGDSADRAGSNLTTYLAAGSAMLMKTAASRNQNLALAKKERKGAVKEGSRPTIFNPSESQFDVKDMSRALRPRNWTARGRRPISVCGQSRKRLSD